MLCGSNEIVKYDDVAELVGEFQDLLRPAFQEDEWILITMGAVMGFVAGWIQLLVGFS